MDLVIMAAGLGSRFGGLKQLMPVDDDNNFLIDYSIFDAIRAGFDHIIFVIKEENLELFKTTIGNRIEKIVSVDYAFQKAENIPAKFCIPSSRTKPFGTGHALLCAKDFVKSDFAVINADDFYGKDAFCVAATFLKNKKSNQTGALIAYEAKNTIIGSEPVKRGVCFCNGEELSHIVESEISSQDSMLVATPLQSSSSKFLIKDNCLVSMNFFAFSKNVLDFFETSFLKFLGENQSDLSSCEFFLPTVVSKMIEKQNAKIAVLPNSSKWFGMTYKDDLTIVKNEISRLKNKKIYPIKLY